MLELWQWTLAALGAYLVGLSKTGIAGLGILSVALFAVALPARESTGIVLVVLIAADIVAITAYRRQVSWPHLWRLFPWAAAGIVLGFLVMGRIDSATTQRLIGVILIFLVVFQFIRRRKSRGAPLAGVDPAPPAAGGGNRRQRRVSPPWWPTRPGRS